MLAPAHRAWSTENLVPEAMTAQRINRAKRQLRHTRLDAPADLGTELRVLHLDFHERYGGSTRPLREAARLRSY